MTAGFLKDLSESAGTPICETRRLSLSEIRSEKLTHSEKRNDPNDHPTLGALQTTEIVLGLRERPS
jgi:hypothetical protein